MNYWLSVALLDMYECNRSHKNAETISPQMEYCLEDPMSYVTEYSLDRVPHDILSGGSHELCHRIISGQSSKWWNTVWRIPWVMSQYNPWTEFHMMEYCPEDPMSYVTEHDRVLSGGSHELCHRIISGQSSTWWNTVRRIPWVNCNPAFHSSCWSNHSVPKDV